MKVGVNIPSEAEARAFSGLDGATEAAPFQKDPTDEFLLLSEYHPGED
jgi:hypothetical protein